MSTSGPDPAGGKSKKKRNIAIAATATIIAAFITAGATLAHSNSPTTSSSQISGGNNNQANGNGNSDCGVIQGNGNSCQQPPKQNENPSAFANPSAPAGTGPWPFMVVNTIRPDGTDIGLIVRTCNHADCSCSTSMCERLGVAIAWSVVYALCQQRTDFDAGTNDKPIWIKIKWPSNKGGTMDRFSSSTNDGYTGWAFGAYLAPRGHNGSIPTCT